MNFIAAYIGHRCTLWLYKFTRGKYFSSSESVSPTVLSEGFTHCSHSALSAHLHTWVRNASGPRSCPVPGTLIATRC